MSNPVVLVYSNRPEVREAVMLAIGRRPAPDVGRVDFLECSSVSEVLMAVDAGEADLAVRIGGAQPVGGMGISRQMHLELDRGAPVVLLIRRLDDRWLSTWAKADEVLQYPVDPVTAAETVAAVLRRMRAVARVSGGAH